MKKLIALAALSSLALAACKDNTQAQLEQQQKQIEALQQQLAQQQDNTIYQLTPEGVKDTIPAEAQANGNNGQPVTGTDGQQFIYDQSTGSCKAWSVRRQAHSSVTRWQTNSHKRVIKTARLPSAHAPIIIKRPVPTAVPASNSIPVACLRNNRRRNSNVTVKQPSSRPIIAAQ